MREFLTDVWIIFITRKISLRGNSVQSQIPPNRFKCYFDPETSWSDHFWKHSFKNMHTCVFSIQPQGQEWPSQCVSVSGYFGNRAVVIPCFWLLYLHRVRAVWLPWMCSRCRRRSGGRCCRCCPSHWGRHRGPAGWLRTLLPGTVRPVVITSRKR